MKISKVILEGQQHNVFSTCPLTCLYFKRIFPCYKKTVPLSRKQRDRYKRNVPLFTLKIMCQPFLKNCVDIRPRLRYIIPSLTAKKRRELINKGFLRFLNCPKRSYILLLFLGFPYYSFHADIRQDLIIRSKTCHLMKPVGKVCPGIGRQISLLFTRPVHVH